MVNSYENEIQYIKDMKSYYEDYEQPEDDNEEKIQMFIDEANHYYEKLMDKKEKMKKKLSPEKYRMWENKTNFAKTKREFQYEEYLKHGYIFA